MSFLKCSFIFLLVGQVQKVFSDNTDCPDIKNVTIYTNTNSVKGMKYTSEDAKIIINGCIEGTKLFKFFTEDIEIRCDDKSTTISNLGTHTIRNIEKLKTISIANCSIIAMEPWAFTNVPKLKRIILENVKTDETSSMFLRRDIFNVIPSLKVIVLQLGIELIEEGAFSNLPKLKAVSLCGNKLTHIHHNWFTNSTNIEDLNLSYNKLSVIKSGIFNNIGDLELLDLCCNQITEIQEDAFKGIKKLKNLFLHHNKITTISGNVLQDPKKPYLIQLYDNEINYLSRSFLKKTLKKEVTVQIWHNPLLCACLERILGWMYKHNINPALFQYRNVYDGKKLNEELYPVCVIDRENPKTCEKTKKPLLSAYYKNKVFEETLFNISYIVEPRK